MSREIGVRQTRLSLSSSSVSYQLRNLDNVFNLSKPQFPQM